MFRLLAVLLSCAALGFAQIPKFKMEEIATGLNVVYAVTTADVNGDGKLDVVAVNNTQLLWFENPTWKKHVVAEKVTEKDNVSVAPYDIDGDGRMDFALGADWQPSNTTGGGSLHWVSSDGKVTNIATEPTLHRIRWGDIDGDGKPELIVVPLHGRDTKPADWMQGAGARILVFSIPKNPATDAWPVEVADASLHIVHNFILVGREIWTASAEGVHALRKEKDGWVKRKIADGKPGEIKLGNVGGEQHLATVDPWHGNSIAVYRRQSGLWPQTVIDSGVNQAHALGWADFDWDGNDELVAGWRGKPWGLALYKRTREGAWTRTMLDAGVAVEDLAVADLNGDGLPDIIAGGRTTQNIRVYWNAGTKP